MLPQVLSKCFAPIDVCGAQFNRLGCNGEILNGPGDVKIACSLVDISLTPNTSTGRTDTARNGGQAKVAERLLADKVEDYTLAMNLVPRIDTGLMELFGTFQSIVDDVGAIDSAAPGSIVGIKPFAASEQDCSCSTSTTCKSGVSALIWFTNSATDADPTVPYVVFAFPMVKFTMTGSWNISDTYSNVSFSATPQSNLHWIDPADYDQNALLAARGPAGIYPESLGLDVPWGAWGTSMAAPGGCECANCAFEYTGTTALGGVDTVEKIEISKVGTPSTIPPGQGDTISYVITVTNSGSTPVTDDLSSIVVSDAKAGLYDIAVPDIVGGGAPEVLDAGVYTVTAEDVANGYVRNWATVSALYTSTGEIVTDSIVTDTTTT